MIDGLPGPYAALVLRIGLGLLFLAHARHETEVPLRCDIHALLKKREWNRAR